MEIINLYSGSKGNGTYINLNGKNILVDCGNSYKKLNEKLLINVGISISELDLILITHSHTDHIRAFKTIYGKYDNIKFIMSSKTFYGIPENKYAKGLRERMKIEYDPERFIFIEDNESINDILYSITAFELKHDEYCLGYILNNNSNNESLCFIADNGGWIDTKVNLKNHTYYCIESNHDRTMTILDNKRNGLLKRRNLGHYGHTNNYDCIKNLSEYVGNNTRSAMFMHLSEDCNSEELAKDIHNTYLDIWGKKELFKNIEFHYAKQNEITIMEGE